MADNTSDTWKLNVELSQLFVYVIGLHAVQFGDNWMKKNSEDRQNWTKPQAEFNLAVRGIF